MTLQGKRAIVTGSTKGIGRSIAQALVAEGASVVISSRHDEDIRKTLRDLGASGKGKLSGQQCDVTDPRQVENLVRSCVQEFGGLEILINNAGVGIFKPVENMSAEEWRAVIATNLDSLFYACRYAIPEIRKSKNGFIINIGSLAGKNAFPNGAAYNASKFGLIGFSEALMQEIRYDDIRVAYIMPGSVDTYFTGRSAAKRNSWKISPEDVAQVVVETLKRPERCLTSCIEMRPSKPPRK